MKKRKKRKKRKRRSIGMKNRRRKISIAVVVGLKRDQRKNTKNKENELNINYSKNYQHLVFMLYYTGFYLIPPFHYNSVNKIKICRTLLQIALLFNHNHISLPPHKYKYSDYTSYNQNKRNNGIRNKPC